LLLVVRMQRAARLSCSSSGQVVSISVWEPSLLSAGSMRALDLYRISTNFAVLLRVIVALGSIEALGIEPWNVGRRGRRVTP